MIMTCKNLAFFTMMVLLPVTSFAKDVTDGKSADIASEKVICGRLFVKANDHAADYKPGVDVNGNMVVGADVSPSVNMVPEYISMPLTVDFAEKLQQKLPQGMEVKPSMGNLKLYKTGKVEFNGQDITKPVAYACGIDPSGYSSEHDQTYIPQPPVEVEAPAAGSVVTSTTGPQPKQEIHFPKGAVKVTEMPTMDSIIGNGGDVEETDVKKK